MTEPPTIAAPKEILPSHTEEPSLVRRFWSSWVQPNMNSIGASMVESHRAVACWFQPSPSDVGFRLSEDYKTMVQRHIQSKFTGWQEAFTHYATTDVCSQQSVIDRNGLATLLKDAGYKGKLSNLEAATILNHDGLFKTKTMNKTQFGAAFELEDLHQRQ